jgi:hypothetical protein
MIAFLSLIRMQVLYSCRLHPRLRVMLSPFGARARDAAYTLNPLAGQVIPSCMLPASQGWVLLLTSLLKTNLACADQGLTSLVRDGSPLHKPVLGSLVGLGLETSRAWLSAGYFAQGASPCL